MRKIENTGDKPQKKSLNQIYYSAGEERFNIISHMVGVGLSIVAAALMIVKASLKAYRGGYDYSALAVVSVCLFGAALILMYLFSSLYHSRKVDTRARVVLRRLDHCAIPILIAGTYAPYTLIGLVEYGTKQPADFVWGIVIASVVLTAAIVTVVFNAINPQKYRVFGMISYVSMGWCVLIRCFHMMLAIGFYAGFFLILGGVVYTVGILFYRLKKNYFHAVWHLFVLAGSILHFVSIFFFVI